MRENGAIPAEKGYPSGVKGVPAFPGSICASVNDVVIHGIPSKREILHDGDIISVDLLCLFIQKEVQQLAPPTTYNPKSSVFFLLNSSSVIIPESNNSLYFLISSNLSFASAVAAELFCFSPLRLPHAHVPA